MDGAKYYLCHSWQASLPLLAAPFFDAISSEGLDRS